MTTNGWHRRNNQSPAARARKKQYNSTSYKRARATAKHTVELGNATCWRCGTWLNPTQPWHLGHDDNDRNIIRGPECVPCNLRSAARKGNAITNGTPDQPKPRRVTRTW